MRTRGKLFILSAVLFTAGCYYGSMTGARTLGQNHMTITGSVGLPAYLSADDRREAGESSIDDVPVSPAVTFLSGATERIDIGAYSRAYGLGPMVRVGLLDPSAPYALSVNAGAGYIIPAKLLSTRFGAAAGYLLGDALEVYGGWDGGYGPDVVNIPEGEDGHSDWDEVKNTFHHSVNAGIRYSLPVSGETWIPEAVGFEFAVPLDLSRNLVMFGIGVTY